ncbi:MAG: cohesin domain-containing protein [Canidatus Methanoxibalbensis ujae]|nr:cohesin domain-containing protein [Candidatus Methanoxibalbensis ujae]
MRAILLYKGRGIGRAEVIYVRKPISVLCVVILLSSLAANIPICAAQPTADAFGIDEDVYGVPGGYTIVPVNITNVTNGPVLSIRFDVLYNASIINVTNVTRGELTQGWDTLIFNVEKGVTRVTVSTASDGIDNESTGSVVLINFSVNKSAREGMKSILNFTNIELADGGEIGTAEPKNSTFYVRYVLPTPFLIHGYVFYENGTACNNASVNITNTNTGIEWKANTTENYYMCELTAGFDVNEGEVLRIDASSPDGMQRRTVLHEVTAQDINNGSLLMNMSLEAFHDVLIKADYTGAYGTGIRIDNATGTIPPDENLTVGEIYFIKYKVENNGTYPETVNISVKIVSETVWELANYSQFIDKYHLGNVTWDTSSLSPGIYDITVSAHIQNDEYPDDNERTRTVIIEIEAQPSEPEIISWSPEESIVNNTEGESRRFNITVDQVVNVRWMINGTEVFNETGVNESEYTNTSAVSGLWNVSVIVENENGTDMHSWIWKVRDITPPASISNLSYTNGTTWINWTWDDPVDEDFSHVLVYIDGEFRENVSKGICHYNATGFGMEETHTISTRTADIYGNINETWVNLTAKTLPDVTPPVTTVVTSPERPASGWWSENVTLTFSRYDPYPGTGVNFTRYMMEGAQTKSWTTVYGEDDFEDVVSAEGITTVYYYSVDNASNNESEEYMKNVTVSIDKTPPEIIDVVLPDVVTVGSEINVTVNVTDALSGVSEVTADGSPLTRQEAAGIGDRGIGIETWKGKITAPSEPGVYNITIVAVDNAGNSAENVTQYTVMVNVRITGETGEVNCSVLPFTTVALYDDGEMIASTTSDEEGDYTIEIMLPNYGDYGLMASKEGYLSENITISITAPGEYERDFIAEYGLIPECPSWEYLIECVENFMQPPTSPCHISFNKLVEVMTAYVQCHFPPGGE